MPDPTAPIEPDKKRTRKPSTPRATTTKRVRHPKPQAILDIEKEAALSIAWRNRLAQSSGGVLKRIYTQMIPRLTPEHREESFDVLSKTETLPLAMPAGERLPLRPETSDGRLRAEEAT